jgi:protein ImuB
MFASLYIPHFGLQAVLRHQPDLRSRPVAVIAAESLKTAVVEFNSAAKSFGVCLGLTATQALARCSELVIVPRSPMQEDAATEILLQTASAFSPSIESTAPGVCILELKGLALQS